MGSPLFKYCEVDIDKHPQQAKLAIAALDLTPGQSGSVPSVSMCVRGPWRQLSPIAQSNSKPLARADLKRVPTLSSLLLASVLLAVAAMPLAALLAAPKSKFFLVSE
jgi:hypothetical protein